MTKGRWPVHERLREAYIALADLDAHCDEAKASLEDALYAQSRSLLQMTRFAASEAQDNERLVAKIQALQRDVQNKEAESRTVVFLLRITFAVACLLFFTVLFMW